MRLTAILLLLICAASAQDGNITRFVNISADFSCPGNILIMNATSSDGLPAQDVELRLVLYQPYLGLRALQHTDSNGLAQVELTYIGIYRIYIDTDKYNHPKYAEFELEALCPPPPPKELNISVEPDCEAGSMLIHASSGGTPVEGVFITTGNWSSLSSLSGDVVFPLEEGYVYVKAVKRNYTTQEFYAEVSCAPPPECVSDADCGDYAFCSGGNCTNVTGECGFASNRTWVPYGCCADSDCGNESMMCSNNTCVGKPVPPGPPIPPPNITANESENKTSAPVTETGKGGCLGAIIPLMLLLGNFVCRKSGLRFGLRAKSAHKP